MIDQTTDVKDVTFVAFSCPHCPFQTQEVVDRMLGRIADIEPDVVVCLGDLFEADAASVHKHRMEERMDLFEEYKSGATFLSAIREAAPTAIKLVWLYGNHDDNLQTNDARRIPKHLRNLIHWNKTEFGSEFRQWQQIPYEKSARGVFRLGQVLFYHGFDVRQGSDEAEALQINNYCGGHAHTLMIRGHTHAPIPVTQVEYTARIGLPFYYANPGTLGPLKPDYMKRKDSSKWGHAFIHGTVRLGRPSRLRQGPQWSAVLELL